MGPSIIFKEVLNNIIKHADTKFVTIQTYKRGQKLYLEIHDMGKGLPSDKRPIHLLKRGKKLNAQIEVEGANPGGTKIKCILPCAKT